MTPEVIKLLKVAKTATEEEAARANLHLRVRTSPRAWATYFKGGGGSFSEQVGWTPNPSIISLGGKMIKRILEYPGGLNNQEMSKLNWGEKFGWSPGVLLATVICHELAHAYMAKKKLNPMRGRYQRAVHGRDFYETLKNLFENRVEDVALRIAELANDESLLEDRDVVLENRTRVRKRRTRNPKPENFNIGDKVLFFGNSVWGTGILHLGTIINWGGRRFTVIEKYPENEGEQKWYMPSVLLYPLEKLDDLIFYLDKEEFLQRYRGQV